jgi:hypothetical protein
MMGYALGSTSGPCRHTPPALHEAIGVMWRALRAVQHSGVVLEKAAQNDSTQNLCNVKLLFHLHTTTFTHCCTTTTSHV